MTWTTGQDLRVQVQRLWDRGALLAPPAGGAALFPRRLTLKVPTSPELADQFDDVRAWIEALRQQPHVRIAWRDVQHRVLGSNTIPHEAWIDTLDDALALIGKQRDAQRFAQIEEQTRARQPALVPWLHKYPLRALDLAPSWPLLLGFIDWLQRHPRPGIYLRQVDLPDIHTKFIEAHRGVLGELLDLALPPQAIQPEATGARAFSRRYGFKERPVHVRFRSLDATLAVLPGAVNADIALDHESFARLNLTPRRVFVIENETNFLAFPNVRNSLAIFGAGYGFDMLADAHWLQHCELFYWGDIDTHGFAILDQLRAQLPHAQSLLMDHATLLAHRAQWVAEPEPTTRDLERLTSDEQTLYDDLRFNRHQLRVRLEQERIPLAWLHASLLRD